MSQALNSEILYVPQTAPTPTAVPTSAPKSVGCVEFSEGMALKDIEKSVILETLKRQRYNRTRTAKVLGIGIRTLQRKLKQYREIDGEVILGGAKV